MLDAASVALHPDLLLVRHCQCVVGSISNTRQIPWVDAHGFLQATSGSADLRQDFVCPPLFALGRGRDVRWWHRRRDVGPRFSGWDLAQINHSRCSPCSQPPPNSCAQPQYPSAVAITRQPAAEGRGDVVSRLAVLLKRHEPGAVEAVPGRVAFGAGADFHLLKHIAHATLVRPKKGEKNQKRK